MVIGYLRVSSVPQDVENQKQGVIALADRLNLTVDKYIIDDGISGTTEPEKRNLGRLLRRVHEGDVILISELSRLARNMLMMFRIVDMLLKKRVKLYSVKDNFTLYDSIQSKVLVFAFGLAAQIERDLISARTKEALARKKEMGVHLGRPFGSKIQNKKLEYNRKKIIKWLEQCKPKVYIAKKCKVTDKTLRKWLKANGLYQNTIEKK